MHRKQRALHGCLMQFKEFFELWCVERDRCEATELLRASPLRDLHKQVLPQESREAFIKCPSMTFLRGVTSVWAVVRGLRETHKIPGQLEWRHRAEDTNPGPGRMQPRGKSTGHQTHQESNPVPDKSFNLTGPQGDPSIKWGWWQHLAQEELSALSPI